MDTYSRCLFTEPLGSTTPVTIRGKLMLQQIWKLGFAWDNVVSEDLASEFCSYAGDLRNLKSFSFPRYIKVSDSMRLFSFADVSEQAYCVSFYLVWSSNLQLYCSKTRVAPLKLLTTPQLEFQAAVPSVPLVERVNRIVQIPLNRISFFTDSTIVLSWLARPANDLVRNRVAKIATRFWSLIGIIYAPMRTLQTSLQEA